MSPPSMKMVEVEKTRIFEKIEFLANFDQKSKFWIFQKKIFFRENSIFSLFFPQFSAFLEHAPACLKLKSPVNNFSFRGGQKVGKPFY